MNQRSRVQTILVLVLGAAMAGGKSSATAALSTAPSDALVLGGVVAGRLPVKEVTVFKDGHAFVLHEGNMPVDKAGRVVLDSLPAPVLGTFWPYAADPGVKLISVVAGKRSVQIERPTTTLRDILEANIGAAGVVTEVSNQSYPATVLGFLPRPQPDPDAPAVDGEMGERRQPTDKSEHTDFVLLQTHEGVRTMQFDRIQSFVFKDPPKQALARGESRNLLTLMLERPNEAASNEARVGLAYLQKGVRWIPSYRVSIGDDGQASIRLQATLLNELTDLEDVKVHLVVGVPTFAFKDTVDPISLQQITARLSPYFQENAAAGFAFSNAFSNGIMTQSARMGEFRAPTPANPAARADADLPESDPNEDLYVFTLEHISLKKGERMVVPIAEFTLPFKDVYVLDVPFTPPPQVQQQFNNQQQAELARLFAAPKVMHKIRFTNNGPHPLTTAPALILNGGRIVAQGMMMYTAVGGTTDLDLTAAVDIQVRTDDAETNRIPNAGNWHGNPFDRVELAGTIGLTNYRSDTVEVEVVRHILGHADTADHDAVVRKMNAQEEAWSLGGSGQPYWWHWYSWPYWWHHFNGIGRIQWKLTLEPNQNVDLKYTWHYFWQ